MEIKVLTKSEFVERIDQFIDLYRKCFSGYISKEIVEWRYIENPSNDLLICVAVDNDRIVANYSASPCKLICNNKEYNIAESLNTMTDPEYSGRGLFGKLASELYHYMAKNNYYAIYGFPNYLSNPLFTKKLDWKNIYEIPTLQLNLSEFNIDIECSSIIISDDDFSLKYFVNYQNERSIYLKKESQYLHWRYSMNPSNEYKNFIIKTDKDIVEAYLICKKYNDTLNIVDCNFNLESNFRDLLNHAIRYAKDKKMETVTIWSQIGTHQHYILETYGFRNKYPITYFGAQEFIQLDGLFDYQNWVVNMGDDNVY